MAVPRAFYPVTSGSCKRYDSNRRTKRNLRIANPTVYNNAGHTAERTVIGMTRSGISGGIILVCLIVSESAAAAQQLCKNSACEVVGLVLQDAILRGRRHSWVRTHDDHGTLTVPVGNLIYQYSTGWPRVTIRAMSRAEE